VAAALSFFLTVVFFTAVFLTAFFFADLYAILNSFHSALNAHNRDAPPKRVIVSQRNNVAITQYLKLSMFSDQRCRPARARACVEKRGLPLPFWVRTFRQR
jgi:hypothetical protein